MFKFALTLFVFLAVFAIGTTLACGPDEEFKECGSACPPRCGNLQPTCIEECRPGCFCKAGLVRSDDGSCIPAARC